MSTTPKEILFEEEARAKLLKGITTIADVIGFTLGPRGRSVGLEKSWGAPSITNDGGKIAKDIELDSFENLGASLAKEVVEKIKEKAGDGTTTGTVLLKSLVENLIRHIASGASPILVKRGMEKAVQAVLEEVDRLAKPLKNTDDIRNIATVSASGNKEIGNLIADAMDQVGKNGVITIEEAKGIETSIEIVEGMQFDRGYISPYFCTNTEKMQVEMFQASILLVEKKISNIHELLPILEIIAKTGNELLIIAEDIEGDALSTLVVNKLRGTLKVAAVKSPGFGDRRKAMLQDIAILTGATVISEEVGLELKDATPEHLGQAEKVTVTKDATTLITSGDEEAIANRIKQIENEIAASDSSYDKEKLLERKAKLTGGVAVIRIGAATEPELKAKKSIAEDCVNATKAAVEEGIVPGGGVALLRASQKISLADLKNDELLGAHSVVNACKAPLKQIVDNTGFEGAVIVEQVAKEQENIGFNAETEKVEDLYAAGVIDPAKVVKSALSHAASVAGIVVISEALMIEAEEKDE